METNRTLQPVHPGEILREEFGITEEKVKEYCKGNYVAEKWLMDVLEERKGIEGSVSHVLGDMTSTSFHFWKNLQRRFDEEVAKDGGH